MVELPPDGREPRSAIVLVDREGTVRAYLNLCCHLPVPLDSGGGQVLAQDGFHLICHTHGALYRPTDGLCVEGPCEGASLSPLRIEHRDGEWAVGLESA